MSLSSSLKPASIAAFLRRLLPRRMAEALARLKNRCMTWLALGGLSLVATFTPYRFVFGTSTRIGHLIGETGYFLRRKQLERGTREIEIFVCTDQPANKTIFEMIRRQTPTIKSNTLIRLIDYAYAKRPDHPAYPMLPHILHDPEVYDRTSNPFALNADQMAQGDEILDDMGIPRDAKIICFAVRDQAYLKAIHPNEADVHYRHEFRNGNIDAYIAMAERIADQGYWLLRMGSVVEKKLQSTHPRVIDYASNHRSDFGDVYLGARCSLFVGDNSGITHFALAQGRPGVRANLALADLHTPWPHYLSVPMLYRDKASGQILSYPECLARRLDRLGRTRDFEEAGVNVVYSDSIDIIAAVEEQLQKLDKTWVPQPGDEDLQERFFSLYPKDELPAPSSTWAPGAPAPNYTPVSTLFLRRHSDLL